LQGILAIAKQFKLLSVCRAFELLCNSKNPLQHGQ
jgi:hypothetical protein